jgi:hypothetical protein
MVRCVRDLDHSQGVFRLPSAKRGPTSRLRGGMSLLGLDEVAVRIKIQKLAQK